MKRSLQIDSFGDSLNQSSIENIKTPKEGSPRKPNKTDYFLLITSVTAVVCTVYWQSLSLPFVQDDWITLNAFKTQGYLSILKQAFAYENALFYRPLARVYLLLMYGLFGANPMPFHGIALILHVINSCFVALIINIITRDRLISYLAAIIYAAAIAIHLDPLTWAVGIYDVGGAFFFFTSIWLFLRNQQTLSAISYFFGCLFKESLFPLSILLIFYSLLLHFTTGSKENNKIIHIDWKHITPFLIATMIVLAVKLSSAVSPFDFPATHPYAIKLFGIHVIRNGVVYLAWMFQSFLPLLSVQVYTDQFYMFALVVALFYGALTVFCLQKRKYQSRQILFLLMWILVALLPVLFLTNHTYRYYATYALPAFVGLFLFLIKESFLHFHVRRNAIAIILISISCFAVFASVFQGNRIYSEGLNQNTLSDGTGLLIRRAAFVNIVNQGLQKHLPSIPSNSVIVIGNADLWSFDKDSGPQFWYDDSTLHVYALSELKYDEDGQPYIDHSLQSQGELYTESTNRNTPLDSSRLFVFEVSNGKLNKIDLHR